MSDYNLLLQFEVVEQRLKFLQEEPDKCPNQMRFIKSANTLIRMLEDRILEVERKHEGQCIKLPSQEEMIARAKREGLIK